MLIVQSYLFIFLLESFIYLFSMYKYYKLLCYHSYMFIKRNERSELYFFSLLNYELFLCVFLCVKQVYLCFFILYIYWVLNVNSIILFSLNESLKWDKRNHNKTNKKTQIWKINISFLFLINELLKTVESICSTEPYARFETFVRIIL